MAANKLKILWICGLPREVQREVLRHEDHGAHAEWSWIMGHLPPPAEVELHIACRTARHTAPRQFDYRGARFHLVPVKARGRLFTLFQFDWRYFQGVAEALRPDVVHGWGTEDAYAHVALRLSPEHHVVEVQGNLNAYRRRIRMPRLTALAAWSERLALARAGCVVAENEYSLGAALPLVRTPFTQAIEHPLRDDFLTSPPADGAGRQVLFLGAIDDRKGIWDALQAFADGAPPDWSLQIVGNGRPEVVARLREFVAGHDLSARVTHHPQLDVGGVIAVMQASSVLLLPTRIDTGPTALKEAMAMGLWPVCYDNTGPRHYLQKFGWGDLAEDLKPAALTNTLHRVLVAQPWRDAAHRAKIQPVIRPHFQRKAVWDQLVALYRRRAHG